MHDMKIYYYIVTITCAVVSSCETAGIDGFYFTDAGEEGKSAAKIV